MLVCFILMGWKIKIRGIKKAHFHTKKDTLQRHGADLHVTQAKQIYGESS
jgi:hypothetical protein